MADILGRDFNVLARKENYMKNTLVVNLIGGQGSGKSTTMADLFALLKWNKIDSEMCTEFAKELVWENRQDTFKDELYIFSKQNHRVFRCNGKVDVIVTDRPLIMTIPYNRCYGNKNNTDWNNSLESLVYNTYKTYNNLNIFLKREKDFNPNGRNETEDQAKVFDNIFKDMLVEFDIPYIEVAGNENAKNVIYQEVLSHIK